MEGLVRAAKCVDLAKLKYVSWNGRFVRVTVLSVIAVHSPEKPRFLARIDGP